MGAMHSTSGGAGDGLRDAALNADAAGAADAAAASGPEHAAQEARRIVKVRASQDVVERNILL